MKKNLLLLVTIICHGNNIFHVNYFFVFISKICTKIYDFKRENSMLLANIQFYLSHKTFSIHFVPFLDEKRKQKQKQNNSIFHYMVTSINIFNVIFNVVKI
jgi:hypothetical protein